MLQRKVLSIQSGCYNEQFLSMNSVRYNKRMLQRKVFINKTWILQRTNAKTNIFINKIRMLQRTILQRTNATPNSFINKIRILQRTMLQRKNGTSNSFINKIRMLQRTRRNTIGRRSTRVLMTCRAYPV